MNLKKYAGIILVIVLASRGIAFSQESEIKKNFIDAINSKDREKMVSIVKENRDKIPSEITAIIKDISPELAKEEKESIFHVAETMATIYKDISGDIAPLKEVKKKSFEAKLSPPVKSTPAEGVYTVTSEGDKNIFVPENIIIKKGETVKWINNDSVAHILASMPLIGAGGIFSPTIESGKSWEYKFEKAGEYFYICFIHKGMIGKVNAEE